LAIANFRFAARIHCFQSEIRNLKSEMESHVGFGFAEAGDAVAVLPLAAFFEKFGALEALEDIALAAKGGRRAQTAML